MWPNSGHKTTIRIRNWQLSEEMNEIEDSVCRSHGVIYDFRSRPLSPSKQLHFNENHHFPIRVLDAAAMAMPERQQQQKSANAISCRLRVIGCVSTAPRHCHCPVQLCARRRKEMRSVPRGRTHTHRSKMACVTISSACTTLFL